MTSIQHSAGELKWLSQAEAQARFAWICGNANVPGQMTVMGENQTSVPANYLPSDCR